MGNSISSQNLDNIASDYILSMNYQSLRKMHNKLYCNKITGLTSNIIDKYLKHNDIHYLLDRIKYGENKENKEYGENKADKDKDKEILLEEKQQICNNISIFYVKIAHIYAAIMIALNPKYIFTDKNNKQIIINLHDKNKIPKNVKYEIYNMGFCNYLINILNVTELTDKPKFCNMNKQVLEIPEFMNLYYDSNYNVKTGNFEGMSDKMKNIFKSNLTSFYYHFTGNIVMPDSIKKFSDIKITQYDSLNLCKNSKIEEHSHYRNKLFAKYATNLKEMVIFVKNKQYLLSQILNNLFSTVNDTIKINSQITEQNIDNIISNTRNQLLELYLKCEDDFINNIKLHETIIESLIILTTNSQIINLNELQNNNFDI